MTYIRTVQPDQCKPKTYDAAFVARVEVLYADGHTQREIAESVGVTQKVIWRLMKNHDIEARVAAKREQRGSSNDSWKADQATYSAYHHRVEAKYGKPKACSACGTTDRRKSFDWANLTGNYPDPDDYARMCRSCHRRYDLGRVGARS